MVYVVVLGIAFVSWYLGMRMGFKVGYTTAVDHTTLQLLSAMTGVGNKIKVVSVPNASPSSLEDDTKGGNA